MKPNLKEIKEICVKEFLLPYEGYGVRLPNGDFLAYPDPATKNDPVKKGEPWTIAWGLTYDEHGVRVREGDVWTLQKALRAKEAVLDGFLSALLKLSPAVVLEPSRRVAAILSWCYNLGMGNYRASTFKRKIDAKEWEEAAEQCLKWNRANGKVMRGLTRRRLAEAAAIINP
jgi:lysozyme